MKILAFVDTHGSIKALRKIGKKAKNADLMVCAGDLTIFEQGLNYFLGRLNKMNGKVLFVHGNHEGEEDAKKSCSLFRNIEFIHKKHLIIGDILFFGWGGGGFSLVDKTFENQTKQFKKIIKKNPGKKIVLVTHAPPYNTKVDNILGEHCGNKSIRKFIKDLKPDLVVCGHLHEKHGKRDKIGKTLIINPGPYGIVISV